MYNFMTGFKPYTNHMARILLVIIGAMVGAVVGLYVAAQVFPLSTNETVYVRSK